MRYFTFNDVDSRTHGHVLSIDRQVLPAIDPVQVKIPRRAGVYVPYIENREIGSLSFKVRFGILGNNNADLRAKTRAIAEWLYNANDGGDTQPLIFSDEPERAYYVHLSGGIDIDEAAAIGEITIEFFSPFAYAFDAIGAVMYSFDSSTGIVNTTNEGNLPVYPYFRLVPTVAVPDLRVDWTGGGSVYINRSFAAWDAIIVDAERMEVYFEETGENLLPYVSIDSRFKALSVGSVTATLNRTQVGAYIRFTKKYL